MATWLLFQFLLTNNPEDVFLFCSRNLSEITYALLRQGESDRDLLSWWKNPEVSYEEKEFGMIIWPKLRDILNAMG